MHREFSSTELPIHISIETQNTICSLYRVCADVVIQLRTGNLMSSSDSSIRNDFFLYKEQNYSSHTTFVGVLAT